MKEEELANLTDEELLQEQKKMKKSKIGQALIIGILIGVFVYSAVKNGFGFFTFFPLLIAYFAFRNKGETKALENELESRNLK